MATEEQLDRIVEASKKVLTGMNDITAFWSGPDARQRAGQLVIDQAEYDAAIRDAA